MQFRCGCVFQGIMGRELDPQCEDTVRQWNLEEAGPRGSALGLWECAFGRAYG